MRLRACLAERAHGLRSGVRRACGAFRLGRRAGISMLARRALGSMMLRHHACDWRLALLLACGMPPASGSAGAGRTALVGVDSGLRQARSATAAHRRATSPASGPRCSNDLRPDATPLRSEVMIEALEDAIAALSGHRRQRRLAAHPRHPHDPARGRRRARAAAAPAPGDERRAGRASRPSLRLRRRARGGRPALSGAPTVCASPAASTSRRCRP